MITSVNVKRVRGYEPRGREMDEEFFDLYHALDVLEAAESKAIEVQSSGQVVGLGLTDAQNLSPKIVPRLE